MERSQIKRAVDRCVQNILTGNSAQQAELRLIRFLIEKKVKEQTRH